MGAFTRKCRECGKEKGLQEFRIKGPSAVNSSKYCHECADSRRNNANLSTHPTYGKVLPERGEERIYPRKYTSHLHNKPSGIGEDEQWCSCCNMVKRKEAFNKDSAKASGHHYYCRECSNEKKRASYVRKGGYKNDPRRDLNVAYIKGKRTVCMVCGTTDKRVLDFHHRDPATKAFCVNEANACRSIEAIEEEIAKCDVVCSNCHRKGWMGNG